MSGGHCRRSCLASSAPSPVYCTCFCPKHSDTFCRTPSNKPNASVVGRNRTRSEWMKQRILHFGAPPSIVPSLFHFLTHTHTRTHARTHTRLTGVCACVSRVSRYQKGKTNLDFTGATDSEWQWHQLGRMQICTSLQTDNHASTSPLSFYRPDALPAA